MGCTRFDLPKGVRSRLTETQDDRARHDVDLPKGVRSRLTETSHSHCIFGRSLPKGVRSRLWEKKESWLFKNSDDQNCYPE